MNTNFFKYLVYLDKRIEPRSIDCEVDALTYERVSYNFVFQEIRDNHTNFL